MFACIGVTTSHLYINELSPWAMSVFTVSTGFLLSSVYGRELSENALAFRNSVRFTVGMIKKLYPLYFVCMILALSPYIIFALKGLYSFDAEMIKAIVLQAFLLHAWNPTYVFSVNGVCWFFSVCAFLFLLFSFIHSLVSKGKTRRSLLLSAIASVVFQCTVSISVNRFLPNIDSKWFNIAFPPCRIFDFTLGCIAGRWVLCFPSTQRSRCCATVLELCALVCTLVSIHVYYYTAVRPSLAWSSFAMIYSLPSMFLVICLARSEGYVSKILGNRLFSYLGFFGASVYLVHRIVSDLLLNVMSMLRLSETVQRVTLPVLAVVVSFAAAIVWNKLFVRCDRIEAVSDR